MPPQDTSDFLAAFAVGTVLGIGATLLLRPEPRSARERLMRELRPHQRQLRGGSAVVPVAEKSRARTGGDVGSDAIAAGRELLAEFRAEVRRIVADARSELRSAAGRPRKRRRPPRLEAAGAGHGAKREGR